MTKPSRRASKGREARVGSSFEVDIALITVNAAKVRGASGASTPPAIIAWASPSRIIRNASPIAIAPDAHELEFPSAGPRAPNAMATLQAPAPANTRVARLGGTQRRPDSRNAA